MKAEHEITLKAQVPLAYPSSIINTINTPNLKGGLSRVKVKERAYSMPIPHALVQTEELDVRVAMGVDEKSAIGAATVISGVMSYMYGDRSKLFSQLSNNMFNPDLPDANKFVTKHSSTSPETTLLEDLNNEQIVDGVYDNRYEKFTSVGHKIDEVLEKEIGMINDPFKDIDKFDKAIMDCFPGVNPDKSTVIMPNIKHMIDIMSLLTFKNINKRNTTKIVDNKELLVPDYSGIESLLNVLFMEE